MATLKELTKKPELLSGGHRMCAGCGAPIAIRLILKAANAPVVVGCATGCLEVATTIYPYTAWNTSYIHNAFENVAATVSGVETAFRALKKRGRLTDDFRFVAIGGDGGTYDIGFQALSGAAERGHKMVYVCYDNGAYMNTGIQRSSATPKWADTTTSPAGSVLPGKSVNRKNLTNIMAAHDIAYVAQAAPSHWRDLYAKAEKAFNADGFAFLNVLAPCPRGWRYDPADTIELTRLAVETCYWPLFEVEQGQWKLTHNPKKKESLRGWLEAQGRFRHLFKPGKEQLLEEVETHVASEWKKLLNRCGVEPE